MGVAIGSGISGCVNNPVGGVNLSRQWVWSVSVG